MQRALRAVQATISHTFVDQNGAPTDPVGTVTVGVIRADGSEVVAPGAATVAGDTDTGLRTYELTPANTTSLDMFTATFTDGGNGATFDEQIAIVGGYYASLAYLRASHETLRSPTEVPDDRVYRARTLAEIECERCTGVSFVPSFARVRLAGDGTPQLYLPTPAPRLIRSVRAYDTVTSYDDFDADQIGAIELGREGLATRLDDVWPSGTLNLVLQVEHGETSPSDDIVDAVARRVRYFVARREASIPARASVWTAPADAGGGTYQLDSASKYTTGDKDVDAVYARYSELYQTSANGDTASKPYSRPFDLDPQSESIFHGGRR